MQKSKIEWCDYTWNPVTGCLHGCPYCYAEKIAKRFCSNEFGTKDGVIAELNCSQGCKGCSEMDGMEFVGKKIRYATDGQRPFPFGFLPTFYKSRLDEPQHVKKPTNIFVVSMGDLFGEWVPDEWIQAVFEACEKAPQHRYLFLTKNPKRYGELYKAKAFPYKSNYWFGSSVTTQKDEFAWFRDTPYKSFVSIEPLLAPLGDMGCEEWPSWVIVGAQTGPGSKQHQPQREWIQNIVEQCRAAGVPVFLKNSLASIWGEPLIQKFPWEAAT
jgi:protein gp37